MIQSIITIVNVKDINYNKNEVKAKAKVTQETHDSNKDIFLLENEKTGERRKSNLMYVSIYDELIVRGNEKFKILHMLTKG